MTGTKLCTYRNQDFLDGLSSGRRLTELSKQSAVAIGGTFDTIDGFSDGEIYAGGRNGLFWRYNRSDWISTHLPINFDILAILCAPNGKVYIAGSKGILLEGREKNWKALKAPFSFTGFIRVSGLE